MSNKTTTRLILLLSLSISGSLQAQTNDFEIYTLFTTQQERQLIDKNRYRTDQVETAVVEKQQPAEARPQEVREPQKLTIKLGGVTLSQSGENIAWLNGKAYENGNKLDDGSIVYISKKVKNLVQLKTPDGKYHSLTTGETMDINYLKPLEG